MKQTMTGFTFTLHGRDYFVPSNLVKRTKALAKKIISTMAFPVNDANVNWLFDHIQRCDMETMSWGYKLCGDRYGNRFTLCIPAGEREDFIIMEVK